MQVEENTHEFKKYNHLKGKGHISSKNIQHGAHLQFIETQDGEGYSYEK